jgi:hypothetical protein
MLCLFLRTYLFARRPTLAKRKPKPARPDNRTPNVVAERVYVPLDEEFAPAHRQTSSFHTPDPEAMENAVDVGTPSEARSGEKPSMRDIFGPGGFLDKCMIGGYEHRPAQLKMAEAVDDALRPEPVRERPSLIFSPP